MKKQFNDKQLYPLLFQNDFTKILKFLEKYGIDSVDRDGRSFLANCIAEHKNVFASKLIEQGANINQVDNDGEPPLFVAIRAKNIEMINKLLNNSKINKHIQDDYGKNALRVALQEFPKDNNLMILLIKHGISPFTKAQDGNSPFSIMKKFDSGELTIGGNKLNIKPVLKEIEKW